MERGICEYSPCAITLESCKSKTNPSLMSSYDLNPTHSLWLYVETQKYANTYELSWSGQGPGLGRDKQRKVRTERELELAAVSTRGLNLKHVTLRAHTHTLTQAVKQQNLISVLCRLCSERNCRQIRALRWSYRCYTSSNVEKYT